MKYLYLSLPVTIYLIFALSSLVFTAPQNGKNSINDGTEMLVKRIDHIFVLLENKEEVDIVASLFSDSLNLPKWFNPSVRVDVKYPNSKFYNTGVYLGNVFFEFVTFNVDSSISQTGIKRARYYGLAFESYSKKTAEELDKRNITRSQKYNFSVKDSFDKIDTLFTNIRLKDFSGNDIYVFFCQYHLKLFSTETFDFYGLGKINDLNEHHKYYRDKLYEMKGGHLGILEVKELLVSVPDFQLYRDKYQKLFEPIKETETGFWKLPEGPALRLIAGDKNKIEKMTIKVRSLELAKNFLKNNNMLGEVKKDSIKLSKDKFYGLDIELVK